MHHRIHDARDIWGVASPGEMLRDRIVSLGKRGLLVTLQGDGTPLRGPGDVLDFYVSDGRWVATCPACNGGVAHFPGTPWTLCPDCGKGYAVRMPPDREKLEKRLMERPPHNRQVPAAWLGVTGKTPLDLLEADIALFGLSHRSWTAPRTWVTSELVTAAIGNTHWRDNLLETGPSKVTTAGDILYATAANSLARLGVGAARRYLRVNAGATAPEWAGAIKISSVNGSDTTTNTVYEDFLNLSLSIVVDVTSDVLLTLTIGTIEHSVDGGHCLAIIYWSTGTEAGTEIRVKTGIQEYRSGASSILKASVAAGTYTAKVQIKIVTAGTGTFNNATLSALILPT